MERALQAELTDPLGYEPNAVQGRRVENRRNGYGQKTLQSDTGPIPVEVPRDRNSSFEPQLVKKRQRRLEGFDDRVLALYVTDAVLEDGRAWPSRPLSAVYPILYFDALFIKTRQEGPVATKAIYLALGIPLEGEKELLGLWVAPTEGSKFWLTVFNELNNRGVCDCLIACVEGLKGLPEAIEAVFPRTQVQLCIVHKLRNSLKYVPWKERKAVAADRRAVYAAPTLPEAEQALTRFSERWDAKYPAIRPSWRADWQRLTVFFDYSPEIRKVIYTTNAIESLNDSLRKLLKPPGAFPNDEAMIKIIYLAIHRMAKKWTMPIRDWRAALNPFVILIGDRVPV